MEYEKKIRILWEKTEEKTARLLAVSGSDPVCLLPETVEDCPVTEIGDYCFAKRHKAPEVCLETALVQKREGNEIFWETLAETLSPEQDREVRELTGSYLEEITLPESLKKIGNMAFYNCVSLKKISMGKGVERVGSDAFMNCLKLTHILMRCSVRDKSGIRLVLDQISSDLTVTFSGKRGIEAMIFYPEYYESYDEIAPAHLFGRKIEGEGFRARQCFQDGVPNLTRYDMIFPKASAEENGRTLRTLVVARLRYPVDMSVSAAALYEDYLKAHRTEIAEELVKEKELGHLRYFCGKKLLSADALEAAARTAAEMEWAEGAASLLHIRKQYFSRPADRYRF